MYVFTYVCMVCVGGEAGHGVPGHRGEGIYRRDGQGDSGAAGSAGRASQAERRSASGSEQCEVCVRPDSLYVYVCMFDMYVCLRRDEIENALLRRKVFDCLAGYTTITWVQEEAPPQAQ